jgi:hypothetical protein
MRNLLCARHAPGSMAEEACSSLAGTACAAAVGAADVVANAWPQSPAVTLGEHLLASGGLQQRYLHVTAQWQAQVACTACFVWLPAI